MRKTTALAAFTFYFDRAQCDMTSLYSCFIYTETDEDKQKKENTGPGRVYTQANRGFVKMRTYFLDLLKFQFPEHPVALQNLRVLFAVNVLCQRIHLHHELQASVLLLQVNFHYFHPLTIT